MAFSPQQFKAQLTMGGARANLFEFRIALPGIAQNSGAASEKITFMAKSASIPESSMPSIPVPYFGREIHVAGDRTFSPFNVTVINDEDYLVRNALESWSNAIKNHQANITQLLRPLDYKVDFEVIHYGKDSRVIKEYKFIGGYPTEIGAMQLDWGANNQITEFPVTFVYDYWMSDTTS